jgi:hypothetical protein
MICRHRLIILGTDIGPLHPLASRKGV